MGPKPSFPHCALNMSPTPLQAPMPDSAAAAGAAPPATRVAEWLRTAGIALRNVLLGGNAAALSLLARPGKLVEYASESLFLLKAMTGRRGIPEANVFEVLEAPATSPVQLRLLRGSFGFQPTASLMSDLVALCLLARILEPRRIFEIGTATGSSTLHLALNAPDATVFTLDLPPGDFARVALRTTLMDDAHIRPSVRGHQPVFLGTEAESRIVALHGDSAAFDFSPYHGNIDLFFVDGAHSYEYVRNDTERALDCVRPGGVIAWHDFGRAGVNGVSRYLRELAAAGRTVYAVPGGSLAFMRV